MVLREAQREAGEEAGYKVFGFLSIYVIYQDAICVEVGGGSRIPRY